MLDASQFTSVLDRRILIGAINELAPPAGLIATQGEPGFTPFCPVMQRDGDKISFDIQFAPSGILQSVGRDENVPERRFPGFGTVEIDAPVWRDRYQLNESMLTQLRRPGTYEERYGRQITADCASFIAYRGMNTMEVTAFQALSGTITLVFPNGSTNTISYRHPPNLLPTASPLWSDYDNADPLIDIQGWIEQLAFHGVDAGAILMSQQVNKYLLNNAKIRDLAKAQSGADILAAGVLPQQLLAGLPHRIYNKSYLLTDRLAAAYTAGTTATLELGDAGELSTIAAGDRIIFGPSTYAANQRAEEGITVVSLSGTTLTISAALTYDFAIGDRVRVHKKFLPEDKFVILPMADGMPWMEWWQAASIHNDYQPGMYALEERISQIPLRHDVVGGVDGMPMFWRQGRHVYADVA